MASGDNNKKILKFENLLEQYYKVEKEMEDLIEEYNNSCNKFIYKEIWKKIDGFPNFLISSWGRVYNVKREVFITQTFRRYYNVALSNNGKIKHARVHRLLANAFLLNPDNKIYVDHVDGNPKNNNMINLRWTTHKENMQNRKIHKNNTTNFKGVYLCKCTNRYRARIRHNDKPMCLGRYDTPELASKAYNDKAKILHGEFYRADQ